MHSSTSLLALVLAATACGQTTADDHQPNQQEPKAGSSSNESAGNGGATGGSNEIPPGGGGSSATPIGGSVTTGGAGGGAEQAGSNSGGSGGSDMVSPDPYAPRSGKFKMVIYSKTAGFRLAGAIETGTLMLNEIAAEVGIDPPLVTEENTFVDDIDAYELVFFMNPSGDIFTEDEQAKFEAWMTKGGAFCGTSAATDTENGWPFYKEIIGQHYQGHGNQNVPDSIVLEASALDHPALVGLPNPWERIDTWRKFSQSHEWSRRPGFTILARKAADQEPIAWVREHNGFRSFYTGIGWFPEVFQDPEVKKHLTGAIMWAVRREHCLVLPKPARCP